MFQLSKLVFTKEKEGIENREFNITKIIIYTLAFLLSMVGTRIAGVPAPFGIAVFTAILSTGAPVGIAAIVITVGTFIARGTIEAGFFLLYALILTAMVYFRAPRYNENDNEKRKLGVRLVTILMLMNLGFMLITGYTWENFLNSVLFTILAYIAYKIFANSLYVINNFSRKKVFASEEVIGAIILIVIACSSFKNFNISGVVIGNIISIFLIAVVAWKNNWIAGVIAGLGVGVALVITADANIIAVPVLMIYGLILGLLKSTSKWYIAALALISTLALFLAIKEGHDVHLFIEIVIATLAMVLVPKNFRINIKDMYAVGLMLPEGRDLELEEVKDVIELDNNNIDLEDDDLKLYTSSKDIKRTMKKYTELTEIEAKLEKEFPGIKIFREDNKKITVKIYTKPCKDINKPTCNIKNMEERLSTILGQKIVLQKQICAIRDGDSRCTYKFASEDKLTLQIGVSKMNRMGRIVSRDVSVQTRMDNGKFLLAISNGKENTDKARNESKTVLTSIEQLLSFGIGNDKAIELTYDNLNHPNTTTTLDAVVIDLYSNKLELLKKNTECPTYLKADTVLAMTTDTSVRLNEGNIIVLCSDSVVASNMDYANSELWIKYLLEKIDLIDSQTLADIIINEAKRNYHDKVLEDMTVIVARVEKKK